MGDTVKLIIEIHKDYYEIIKHNVENHLTDYRPFEIIGNGIPLDDIKAEIFRQSEQNNENFSHDWNEGFNDGMFHTLTIIRELST